MVSLSSAPIPSLFIILKSLFIPLITQDQHFAFLIQTFYNKENL